jgi:uncharacterized repeat protein (TIGR03943 family)
MDGRILFYISQRFVVLVLLAGVGMVVLAQVVLRERARQGADDEGDEHEGHDHGSQAHGDQNQRVDATVPRGWTLWLALLPLLIGVLVPERPLSVRALEARGVNLTSGLAARGSAAQAIEVPSRQRTVFDWLTIYSENEDVGAFEGQPADVTGFVYQDPRLGEQRFMASRFTIACCVADAMALGMAVDWSEADALPSGQWVRVRGLVYTAWVDGKRIPAIAAEQVETVPQPEQPYLFP